MKKEVARTKEIYAEAVLYAYPELKQKFKKLSEVLIDTAVGSMDNVGDPMDQYLEVIMLNMTKDVIKELYAGVNAVFGKFTDEELDILTYKYFKNTPYARTYEVLTKNRDFFRQRVKLFNKFRACLNRVGLDDAWFESECAAKFMKQYIDKINLSKVNLGLDDSELRKSINPRGFCVYGQKA